MLHGDQVMILLLRFSQLSTIADSKGNMTAWAANSDLVLREHRDRHDDIRRQQAAGFWHSSTTHRGRQQLEILLAHEPRDSPLDVCDWSRPGHLDKYQNWT
jgi:hypothetical protein